MLQSEVYSIVNAIWRHAILNTRFYKKLEYAICIFLEHGHRMQMTHRLFQQQSLQRFSTNTSSCRMLWITGDRCSSAKSGAGNHFRGRDRVRTNSKWYAEKVTDSAWIRSKEADCRGRTWKWVYTHSQSYIRNWSKATGEVIWMWPNLP